MTSGDFEGNILTLNVPWANESTYRFGKFREKVTLPIKLQSAKPAEYDTHAVHLEMYLHPSCSYQLKLKATMSEVMGQVSYCSVKQSVISVLTGLDGALMVRWVVGSILHLEMYLHPSCSYQLKLKATMSEVMGQVSYCSVKQSVISVLTGLDGALMVRWVVGSILHLEMYLHPSCSYQLKLKATMSEVMGQVSYCSVKQSVISVLTGLDGALMVRWVVGSILHLEMYLHPSCSYQLKLKATMSEVMGQVSYCSVKQSVTSVLTGLDGALMVRWVVGSILHLEMYLHPSCSYQLKLKATMSEVMGQVSYCSVKQSVTSVLTGLDGALMVRWVVGSILHLEMYLHPSCSYQLKLKATMSEVMGQVSYFSVKQSVTSVLTGLDGALMVRWVVGSILHLEMYLHPSCSYQLKLKATMSKVMRQVSYCSVKQSVTSVLTGLDGALMVRWVVGSILHLEMYLHPSCSYQFKLKATMSEVMGQVSYCSVKQSVTSVLTGLDGALMVRWVVGSILHLEMYLHPSCSYQFKLKATMSEVMGQVSYCSVKQSVTSVLTGLDGALMVRWVVGSILHLEMYLHPSCSYQLKLKATMSEVMGQVSYCSIKQSVTSVLTGLDGALMVRWVVGSILHLEMYLHPSCSYQLKLKATMSEVMGQVSYCSVKQSVTSVLTGLDGALMVRWVVGSILHLEMYFHPSCFYQLHDWCNKGCGMCYPVCGMVHIKEPVLLIGKSSPCGGSGFPLFLSEWYFTICPMPYNRK